MVATVRWLFAFGVFVHLLACTAAFERSHVVDEVPLVQKSWRSDHEDLSSDTSEALAPNLQAALRQMPLSLQQPFDIPPDLSIEKVMAATVSIFQAFRNPSFVAAIHESLSNNTRDFAEFVSTVRTSIFNLQNSTARSHSEDPVLEALEEFWRRNELAWGVFMSKVAAGPLRIAVRQPNEVEAIGKAFAPLLNSSMFGHIGVGQLGRSLESSFSQYRANDIFLDKRNVCPKLKALWPQMRSFEPKIMFEVIPALSDEKSQSRMQVQQLCEAFAPDVSDELMGVANRCLKVALNMVKDWQPVLHDSVAAVEATAEEGLRCELPRVEEQAEQQAEHAGGTCSRLSALASAAVAAAAVFALGL